MDIRLDIMANGTQIIYNLVDDLMIEEPCEVHLQHKSDGTALPSFLPLLMISGTGKCAIHSQSHVLYSVRPNPDLHNMFVEMLNQCRARRSGIIAPTPKPVITLKK